MCGAYVGACEAIVRSRVEALSALEDALVAVRPSITADDLLRFSFGFEALVSVWCRCLVGAYVCAVSVMYECDVRVGWDPVRVGACACVAPS